MENQLITIQGVRGYIDNVGTAHLNLEDVARGLGFIDTSKGTEYVRWNTVKSYLNDLGFSQEVAKDDFIPENIFYRLAMKAKNETAERFQAKVADEILPSIRKHGMYAKDELLDNPDLLLDVIQKLKQEREEKKLLMDKLEQQKPLVMFAETCIASNDSILVRELAKLASKNGVMIGEKRLYKKLREWGLILNRKNEPSQKAMDAGWFEVKKGTYSTPYGSETYATSLVTPKGQVYIIERLRKEKSEAC
jgi:anti-repressor protein